MTTMVKERPAAAPGVAFREVSPVKPAPGRFADAEHREPHDDDAFAWLTVTSVLLGVVSMGVAGMAVTVLWIVLGH